MPDLSPFADLARQELRKEGKDPSQDAVALRITQRAAEHGLFAAPNFDRRRFDQDAWAAAKPRDISRAGPKEGMLSKAFHKATELPGELLAGVQQTGADLAVQGAKTLRVMGGLGDNTVQDLERGARQWRGESDPNSYAEMSGATKAKNESYAATGSRIGTDLATWMIPGAAMVKAPALAGARMYDANEAGANPYLAATAGGVEGIAAAALPKAAEGLLPSRAFVPTVGKALGLGLAFPQVSAAASALSGDIPRAKEELASIPQSAGIGGALGLAMAFLGRGRASNVRPTTTTARTHVGDTVQVENLKTTIPDTGSPYGFGNIRPGPDFPLGDTSSPNALIVPERSGVPLGEPRDMGTGRAMPMPGGPKNEVIPAPAPRLPSDPFGPQPGAVGSREISTARAPEMLKEVEVLDVRDTPVELGSGQPQLPYPRETRPTGLPYDPMNQGPRLADPMVDPTTIPALRGFQLGESGRRDMVPAGDPYSVIPLGHTPEPAPEPAPTVATTHVGDTVKVEPPKPPVIEGIPNETQRSLPPQDQGINPAAPSGAGESPASLPRPADLGPGERPVAAPPSAPESRIGEAAPVERAGERAPSSAVVEPGQGQPLPSEAGQPGAVLEQTATPALKRKITIKIKNRVKKLEEAEGRKATADEKIQIVRDVTSEFGVTPEAARAFTNTENQQTKRARDKGTAAASETAETPKPKKTAAKEVDSERAKYNAMSLEELSEVLNTRGLTAEQRKKIDSAIGKHVGMAVEPREHKAGQFKEEMGESPETMDAYSGIPPEVVSTPWNMATHSIKSAHEQVTAAGAPKTGERIRKTVLESERLTADSASDINKAMQDVSTGLNLGKARDVRKQSLPSNHTQLVDTKANVAVQNPLMAALDTGNTAGLSPFLAGAVKAIHKINYITGGWARAAGVEKAMGGALFKGYEMGRGFNRFVHDDFVNALINIKGAREVFEKSMVRHGADAEKVRAWMDTVQDIGHSSSEAMIRRDAMEMTRQFKWFPSDMYVNGRHIKVLDMDLPAYIRRVTGGAANRVAFIKEFGKAWDPSTTQKFEDADIGSAASKAIHKAFTSMHGRDLGLQTPKWADAMNNILTVPGRALNLSLSGIGNTLGVLGHAGSVPAASFARGLAKAITQYKASGKAAENIGALPIEMVDLGGSAAGIAADLLRTVSHKLSMNRFSALVAANAAVDYAQVMASGKWRGSKFEMARLKNLGFSEAEATKFLDGKASKSDVGLLARKIVEATTSEGASRASQGLLHRYGLLRKYGPAFASFAEQQMRNFVRMGENAATAANKGDWASARAHTAQALLKFGGLASGAAATVAALTFLRGGPQGVQQKLEGDGIVGEILWRGFVGGSMQAAIDTISAVRKPGKLQAEDIGRALSYPAAKAYDLIKTYENIKDDGFYDAVLSSRGMLANQTPAAGAMRDLLGWSAAIGEDPNRRTAVNSFYKWAEKNPDFMSRPFTGNMAEPSDISKMARQVIIAAKNKDNVARHKAIGAAARTLFRQNKDLGDLREAILNKRVLDKLKGGEDSDERWQAERVLRKAIGPMAMRQLRLQDMWLESLADMVD